MGRRGGRLVAPALVPLALALLLAGCGGVQTLAYPTPEPTTATTATPEQTLPDNLSSVGEAAVAGVTTTTVVAIGPGSSTLSGTVIGPNGPVSGATIEADRLVGYGEATTTTTSGAGGVWTIANVLGGRYRIRAWQAPTMAMNTPDILFVGSGPSQSISLQMTSYSSVQIAASMAPGSPVADGIDNLAVQVITPTVSSDGVEVGKPDVGASVSLTDGPEWRVYNGNPLTTGATGEALFQVSCQVAGSDALSATVGTTTEALQVPDCGAAPTTTVPPTSTTLCPPGQTASLPSDTTTTTFVFGGC